MVHDLQFWDFGPTRWDLTMPHYVRAGYGPVGRIHQAEHAVVGGEPRDNESQLQASGTADRNGAPCSCSLTKCTPGYRSDCT